MINKHYKPVELRLENNNYKLSEPHIREIRELKTRKGLTYGYDVYFEDGSKRRVFKERIIEANYKEIVIDDDIKFDPNLEGWLNEVS